MEARVRPLHDTELEGASHLLARAFAHDPFIGYFFRGPRRRRLALPSFFRAVLCELSDSSALFASEVQGRLAGVAAWAPPEPAEPASRSKRHAQVASMQVRTLFPRAAPKVKAGFEALGERHPSDPHWYLAFVGIEPAQQNKGLGSTLLSPVLERADSAGAVCYLETPFTDTRRFYRRFGFEDTDELRPVKGAPPVWTMTRPASSLTDSTG